MEQWRLHVESMWTAHKRKWLNSWCSSVRNGCVTCHHFDGKPCAEMTVPLPGSRVNLVHPFYSCGIDYASRRPLLARVPDYGEQCQQVTPAMLMGNFFVSEPCSLEEEQLQSQERTTYQRVMLCCWKKKRSDWSLGFGQGLSAKRKQTLFFCTFCSLFDPVGGKFMVYSIHISFWLGEEHVAGAYVGFQVKSRRMFALCENHEFVKT